MLLLNLLKIMQFINLYSIIYLENIKEKKMEKKGFTLIEILVVIALVAAISVTVGVSMSKVFKNEDDKKLKDYYETIEKAACVYAEINNLNESKIVNINTLLTAGLISKNLKNPSSNKLVTEDNDIKGVEINFSLDNNEKSCKIKTS